jgi:HEAT repeat protein
MRKTSSAASDLFSADAAPQRSEAVQLDLFASPPAAVAHPSTPRLDPTRMNDDALIAAIGEAGIADVLALVAEAGRRGLTAAVPTLVRLCQRHAGYGLEREVPEQAAALRAMAAIGGTEAVQAVAHLLTRSVLQGPTLAIGAACAARLRCRLPGTAAMALLRHPDPDVRASACPCAGQGSEITSVLLELLDDLHERVRLAAAMALAQRGRREARPILLALLRRRPTADVIDAIAEIADAETLVLLGRIARAQPALAAAAMAALAAVEDPQAEKILAALVRDLGQG